MSDTKVPAKGEFCDRHFSWLCQAGQGKCQFGDDWERPPVPAIVPALGTEDDEVLR